MNWIKKETLTCSGHEVTIQIQNLLNKYRTNIIVLKRNILINEQYKIEVWYNVDSTCYLLNVFIYENFDNRDDEIIDVNVSET